MDTDSRKGNPDMDRCKHDLDAATCDDCKNPVRRAPEFDRQPQANDWSAADERFVLDGRDEFTAAELGACIGRTALAVTAKLAQLDGRDLVSKANEEARKEAARAAATNHREPWSANEDSFLMDSVADGASVPSIAAVLGRSIDAVHARLYFLRRQGEVA